MLAHSAIVHGIKELFWDLFFDIIMTDWSWILHKYKFSYRLEPWKWCPEHYQRTKISTMIHFGHIARMISSSLTIGAGPSLLSSPINFPHTHSHVPLTRQHEQNMCSKSCVNTSSLYSGLGQSGLSHLSWSCSQTLFL